MVASARERLINERAVQLHRGLQGYLAARDSLENIVAEARQFLAAIDEDDSYRATLNERFIAAQRELDRHCSRCSTCEGWRGSYCGVLKQLQRNVRVLSEGLACCGQLAAVREALAFYGDAVNWEPGLGGRIIYACPVTSDKGEKARAALSAEAECPHRAEAERYRDTLSLISGGVVIGRRTGRTLIADVAELRKIAGEALLADPPKEERNG